MADAGGGAQDETGRNATVRGGRAREAGAATMAALRHATVRTAATLICSDSENAATALEIGLVDQEWLDAPSEHPISSSTPTSILRRSLERTVATRPSLLSSDCDGADAAVAGTGRPMTIVFTDLEGFTAYTEANRDAAALAVIGEHHPLAWPVVRRWDGQIMKHLGDGLLRTFPDPTAGMRAALQLLATAPAPLRLRAGAHTGDAVSTRDDVGRARRQRDRTRPRGGGRAGRGALRAQQGATDEGVQERVRVCEASSAPVHAPTSNGPPPRTG